MYCPEVLGPLLPLGSVNTVDCGCVRTGSAAFWVLMCTAERSGKGALQSQCRHMVGLLVHSTLGGNLETKTSLARERVRSCLKQALNVTPPSQLLKLLCWQLHCSALAAWVGKHQSTTDSTASKSATRFRATHKGSNDRSRKDRLTQQAGRQAAPAVPQSACSLEPVAPSSGSENAPVPRHPTLEKAESL